MKVDVGIIGGTGVGSRLAVLGGRLVHVPTAYGVLRGRVVELEGKSVLLAQRHGVGHRLPPHRVSYRALAAGLQALGVRACLATAAVGSLRKDWPIGTLALCSDFVDLSARGLTLFDREVSHQDFSAGSSAARSAVLGAAAGLGLEVKGEAVYVGVNGPRYETPAEIRHFANLGDVVGMTAASEAVLMREAGIDYACLAIVTNLGTGLGDAPLDHGDVGRALSSQGDDIVRILLGAVAAL